MELAKEETYTNSSEKTATKSLKTPDTAPESACCRAQELSPV